MSKLVSFPRINPLGRDDVRSSLPFLPRQFKCPRRCKSGEFLELRRSPNAPARSRVCLLVGFWRSQVASQSRRPFGALPSASGPVARERIIFSSASGCANTPDIPIRRDPDLVIAGITWYRPVYVVAISGVDNDAQLSSPPEAWDRHRLALPPSSSPNPAGSPLPPLPPPSLQLQT